MHIHPDILLFAVLLLIILAIAVQIVVARKKGKPLARKWLETIRYIGQISLVLGVLLQAIELTRALDGLGQAGESLTTGQIADGFKSTLYATIHGLLVYVIAMVTFVVLKLTDKREEPSDR